MKQAPDPLCLFVYLSFQGAYNIDEPTYWSDLVFSCSHLDSRICTNSYDWQSVLITWYGMQTDFIMKPICNYVQLFHIAVVKQPVACAIEFFPKDI